MNNKVGCKFRVRGKNSVILHTALVASAIVAIAQRSNAQATYTLKPTPKTVAWGYYDAKTPAVLRVKSGDTVEIQTLITSSPERLEKAGVPPQQVEQSLRDIYDQVKDKGPAVTFSRDPSTSKALKSAMCSK